MKNIITVLIVMLPLSGFSFLITGHWNATYKTTGHEVMLHISDSGTLTIRYIELDPDYPHCRPDVKTFVRTYTLYPQSNDLAKLLVVDPKSGVKTELSLLVINRKNTQIDSFYLTGEIQHILPLNNAEKIQFRRVSQFMPDRTVRYVYHTKAGGIVDQLVAANDMSSSTTFTNIRLKNRIIDLDGQTIKKIDGYIFQITNAFRNENGQNSLINEPSLDSAAQKQVVYLASDWIKKGTKYLSHTQDTGSEFYTGGSVSDRIGRNNKLSLGCSENILYTHIVPDNIHHPVRIKPEKIKELAIQMVDQWINSPGHRSNMLNMKFQSMGCKSILLAYQYDDYYINVNGEKIIFTESLINKESYIIIAAQVFSTLKN